MEEPVPQEIEQAVKKKLEIMKPFETKSAPAATANNNMEIIREATYEEDEESKSKIQEPSSRDAEEAGEDEGSRPPEEPKEIVPAKPKPRQSLRLRRVTPPSVKAPPEKEGTEEDEPAPLKLIIDTIKSLETTYKQRLDDMELRLKARETHSPDNGVSKTLAAENKELRSSIQALIARVEALESHPSPNTELEASAQQLHAKQSALAVQTANLELKLRESEKDISDIKNALQRLSEVQKVAASKLEDLWRASKRDADETKARLEAIAGATGPKSAQVEKRLETVQRSHEAMRRQVSSAAAKVQQLAKETAEMREEIKRAPASVQPSAGDAIKSLPEFAAVKQRVSQALV